MKTPSLLLITVPLALSAGSARAVAVTYSIVPGSSSLTLSGDYSGFAFSQQAPGSLVDSLSGFINGDLTGGTLTFSGGSSIVASENAAPPFNPAGAGVDNWGVSIAAIGATGAYRDFVWDITSGSVTHGSPPGSIPVFTIFSGVLDYFAPPLDPQSGQLPYAAAAAPNSAGGNVTITTAGTTETLTFPVTLVLDLSAQSAPNQTWTGTIVATRTVIPEPASAVLAGLAAGLLLRRRRQ
jgi:hypothetical protein